VNGRAQGTSHKATARTHAVIIDEAHSSQTGETAKDMIEKLNERFGLKLTEADRLHLDSIAQDLIDDETVQRQAAANSVANFGVQFPHHFQSAVVDRLRFVLGTQLCK
jgi:hypothetical protein